MTGQTQRFVLDLVLKTTYVTYQFVKYYIKRNNEFFSTLIEKKTLIGKWRHSQDAMICGCVHVLPFA